MSGLLSSRAGCIGAAILLVVVPVVIAVAMLSLSGPGRAILAGNRGFEPYAGDRRIQVERGADPRWAAKLATELDGAIADVERAHGRPFAKPPEAWICSSAESFNRRTASPEAARTRAVVFLGRVYMAPSSFATETEREILTHELSHLHFIQALGQEVVGRLPGWFQEGFAVYVSGGGGAEEVSVYAAKEAIRQGQVLKPEVSGSFIPRTAADHGLSHFMFYRQSAMFVGYLAARDSVRFRSLLDALYAGEPFDRAFEKLGITVDAAWNGFVADLMAGSEGRWPAPDPARPKDAGSPRHALVRAGRARASAIAPRRRAARAPRARSRAPAGA